MAASPASRDRADSLDDYGVPYYQQIYDRPLMMEEHDRRWGAPWPSRTSSSLAERNVLTPGSRSVDENDNEQEYGSEYEYGSEEEEEEIEDEEVVQSQDDLEMRNVSQLLIVREYMERTGLDCIAATLSPRHDPENSGLPPLIINFHVLTVPITQGTSDRAISILRRVPFSQLSEGDDVCSICLDSYISHDFVIPHEPDVIHNGYTSILELPCGHTFGSICINKWLETEHTCPRCRSKLETSAADVYSGLVDLNITTSPVYITLSTIRCMITLSQNQLPRDDPALLTILAQESELYTENDQSLLNASPPTVAWNGVLDDDEDQEGSYRDPGGYRFDGDPEALYTLHKETEGYISQYGEDPEYSQGTYEGSSTDESSKHQGSPSASEYSDDEPDRSNPFAEIPMNGRYTMEHNNISGWGHENLNALRAAFASDEYVEDDGSNTPALCLEELDALRLLKSHSHEDPWAYVSTDYSTAENEHSAGWENPYYQNEVEAYWPRADFVAAPHNLVDHLEAGEGQFDYDDEARDGETTEDEISSHDHATKHSFNFRDYNPTTYNYGGAHLSAESDDTAYEADGDNGDYLIDFDSDDSDTNSTPRKQHGSNLKAMQILGLKNIPGDFAPH